MRIRQAEGWYLWEKSMGMRRQGLRRTVARGPRRDRLASILVLLLTATGLLVTPTFGGSREEIIKYGLRRAEEGAKRMDECRSERPVKRIRPCQDEAHRILKEGLQCAGFPEECGAISEGRCNSQRFKACLAGTAKEFERMYDACRGAKPADDFLAGILSAEGRFAAGVGLEAARIVLGVRRWMADPTATAGELKRIIGGSFGRGLVYFFLFAAALETYELLRDYPEWSKNLDNCMDLADRLKTLEDEGCARESGCWPHR